MRRLHGVRAHRALAAALAMRFRCAAERLAARALPPAWRSSVVILAAHNFPNSTPPPGSSVAPWTYHRRSENLHAMHVSHETSLT
jgi:hypothetical protein